MAYPATAPLCINGHDIGDDEPQAADAVNHKYLYITGKSDTPLKASHKRELRNIGVEVFEYLGSNTYLCRYVPHDLQPIRDLPFVEQANVYGKRLKVSEFLNKTVEKAQNEHPESPRVTVSVTLHKGETATDELRARIAAQAGLSVDDVQIDHNLLRIDVDNPDVLEHLAEIDEIRALQPFFRNVARNDVSTVTMGATSADISSLLGTAYKGDGQVVHIADSGFDKGSRTDVHPAFSPDRIVDLIDNSRRRGKTNDPDGHGTHVAGSILGDGISDSMSSPPTRGGKITGVAPLAKFVMNSVYFQFRDPETGELRDAFNIPTNLWDLFLPAYTKYGARVSSHSWGSVWDGRQEPYNDEATSADRFVWHHQDFVVLFAGGNDGDLPSPTHAHIGGSSAAKNCITVGATQAERNIQGGRFHSTGTPGSARSLAFFSSLGPTVEKRLKPDVVAPGLPILSASSRDPAITPQMRDRFGITQDQLWAFSSGTSMSCPLVAGCCVILREALIKTAKVEQSSAALVKALLINGAVDIGLTRDQQGFGLVNLKRALVPIEASGGGRGTAGFADEGFVTGKKLSEEDGSDSWSKEIDIPDADSIASAGKVLKVTLAYSDRPLEDLQNDLALQVQIDSVEKAGNAGLRAENNVEQVVWKDVPASKKAKITVTVNRMARLDDEQAFAVVWGLYDTA
ncbi:hypothetical protein OQA88_7959 [Cercophora sp. LCS_1]